MARIIFISEYLRGGKQSAQGYLTKQGIKTVKAAFAKYIFRHRDDYRSAAVGNAVLRMLHHMSKIFRENTAAGGAFTGLQIDRNY